MAKYERLLQRHLNQGLVLPPTASYEHTVMRVKTMSEKRLSTRVKVIERCGHCVCACCCVRDAVPRHEAFCRSLSASNTPSWLSVHLLLFYILGRMVVTQ
jgi:hypothetical protein